LVNCSKCKRPTLSPENYEAYNIIKKYHLVIRKQDYVLDLQAIDKAMEYEGIPTSERAIVAEKVIVWFSIINNKLYERSK